MILKQFYLNCLAHASYLVGDEQAKIAAVVDPQRDIEQYLAFAADHGLRIAHVFLTHFHADFLAGHLELRDRTGATIYLGASARAEYPFTPLHDGDVVELGRVRLQALETPGHTAESISLTVFDLDRSATEPQAVLTGDTLFVGDVGRPDLRVALGWSASDLGGLLYDSVHGKLMALPDHVSVYPAHGAGSLCGKALSKETSSTIGEQRQSNYALQPMSKAAFVDLVTADQPDAPSYFTYDAVLNTKERPTLAETLERLSPLTLDQVLALQAVGAQILDTREASAFAAAHLIGSVNIGLGGQYRHLGRDDSEPRAPDRDRRRSGSRARGRDAARPHRLRSRRRLPRGRDAQPGGAPGSHGRDRASQRAGRRRPRRQPSRRPGRRCSSTSARRASGSRSASPAVFTCRSTISPSGAPNCRPIGRWSSIAPADIDRRSPRACCSSQASRTSARSPAGSRRGNRRTCRSKPANDGELFAATAACLS